MMADRAGECSRCSDNFIVNSKFIECKLCKLRFHLMCVSIKDSWLKIFSENTNIMWVCDQCKPKCTFPSTLTMVSENVNRIPVEDNYKVMAAENVLYQKLVKEMDTKNAVLQENCTLLKEKVELLRNQVYKNKEDYTSAPPVMPGSRATSTAADTSRYSSVAGGAISTKPIGNLAKPTQNHQQSAKTNNNQIRPEQVKAAIHEAQSVLKVQEIQNLSKELPENNNNAPDGWKQVKRRRRFIVGRNQNLNTVQTVPKS
ncbi:unnamed protein product [Callosobruchus maculatus]|uniref:PHD-type domain-containing protein n=1 Tax=Callosobruchus maculatus TaxID=64391 RepID=A0A653BUL8_CALMS|nr:unnamed protein product [Callosobruchus maculatus]